MRMLTLAIALSATSCVGLSPAQKQAADIASKTWNRRVITLDSYAGQINLSFWIERENKSLNLVFYDNHESFEWLKTTFFGTTVHKNAIRFKFSPYGYRMPGAKETSFNKKQNEDNPSTYLKPMF